MPYRRQAPLKRSIAAVAFAGALLLQGCGGPNPDYTYPKELPGAKGRPDTSGEERVGLFGPGGIKLFGGKDEAAAGSPIAVNSYLWRASLDTLSFMPLSSADPFGGVIITDWYAPPQTPAERFKLTVYILDRQLRADGIKVAVFRQVRDSGAGWVDAEVSAATASGLENAILTRARQLRIGLIAP